MAAPRLRHHHHHGVWQLASGEHQQLEHVVEHGRVGAVEINDRKNFGEIGAEQARSHHGLTRVHPINIAAQRVDFTVV